MKYWFTSDNHFNHTNIITYTKRPFKTVYEMNNEMIKRWNDCVKKDDIVFHLGDFGFFKTKKEYDDIVEQLNGTIIQIKGNHDNKINSIIHELVIHHGGRNIFISHIPENCINSGMDICFCGHIHEKWKHSHLFKKTKKEVVIINVGVDVWDFRPIDIETIIKYLRHEGITWTD